MAANAAGYIFPAHFGLVARRQNRYDPSVRRGIVQRPRIHWPYTNGDGSSDHPNETSYKGGCGLYLPQGLARRWLSRFALGTEAKAQHLASARGQLGRTPRLHAG